MSQWFDNLNVLFTPPVVGAVLAFFLTFVYYMTHRSLLIDSSQPNGVTKFNKNAILKLFFVYLFLFGFTNLAAYLAMTRSENEIMTAIPTIEGVKPPF